MAGTGLPLVGLGLDEEPTIVPQLFIPVGPEKGGLFGARSGSISSELPNRVNPRTPALMTRKPTDRPESLIANACEFAPMRTERMPVAGLQMKVTGGSGEGRSETPTMPRLLFTPNA